MKVIVYISKLLTVIGGLNIGFVGFFGLNPLEALGCCPLALQLIYCLIGMGALIMALSVIGCFSCCCGCKCSCNGKEGNGCKCGCQEGKPCTCESSVKENSCGCKGGKCKEAKSKK